MIPPAPVERRFSNVLLLAVLVVWAGLCFTHLYRFSLPGADDWALFGGGAAVREPLALRAPLLGDFLGSDHTWGIHWPGAPLLYSALLGWLPWAPLQRVAWLVTLWVILALVTFRLISQYARTRLLAVAGTTVLLADRPLFNALLLARPELPGALTLAGLVLLLAPMRQPGTRPGGGRTVGIVALFAFLPLVHPLALVVGGLLCAYVCWRCSRGWRTARLGAVAGYAAGGLALAAWFGLQPDALRQFRLNATASYQPEPFGSSLLKHFQDYAPTYSGALVYILALTGGLIFLIRTVRPPGRSAGPGMSGTAGGWTDATDADRGLPVCAVWGGTLAAQALPNSNYAVVLLPLTILSAVLTLRSLPAFTSRPTSPGTRKTPGWLAAGLALFVLVHGAFWASRTIRYIRDGQPDLRAELRDILAGLPAANRVLIPEIMWEEGLRDPGKYQMYSPIYGLKPAREAYERALLDRMRPGDLLLLNEHSVAPLFSPLLPGEWEPIRKFTHVVPSRSGYFGYELTCYRRR